MSDKREYDELMRTAGRLVAEFDESGSINTGITSDERLVEALATAFKAADATPAPGEVTLERWFVVADNDTHSDGYGVSSPYIIKENAEGAANTDDRMLAHGLITFTPPPAEPELTVEEAAQAVIDDPAEEGPYHAVTRKTFDALIEAVKRAGNNS